MSTDTLVALWWVFPIALGICVTSCTLAMEGAVLFTPAFLFLFPWMSPAFPSLSANEAIGLALVIEFFGYGSSSVGYLRQRVVDFSLVRKLLLFTIPVAIGARLIAFAVPSFLLFILFGGVLLVLARTMLVSLKPHATAEPVQGAAANRVTRELLARDGKRYRYQYQLDQKDGGAAVAAGSLVGLIGVGLGEIVNTVLMARHRLPMRVSTGTAIVVVAATVLASSLTHMATVLGQGGQVAFPWVILFLIAPAVLIGGQIAPHVAARVPEFYLKRFLILMFVLAGLLMLFRGLVSASS